MRKKIIKFLCRLFIPNQNARNRVYFSLYYWGYVRKCIKFVKSQGDFHNFKKIVGHGCRNLVVIADNKWVFKFPRRDNGYEKSIREKRITDVFRSISPFPIPDMEILDMDGIAVRKYPFISGINLEYFDPQKFPHDIENKIAKQVAQFLYVIGQSDPKELRDLKKDPKEKTGILHGWCQNDVKYNFILNPKTFDIIAVIDWEEAGFNDFAFLFTYEKDYRSVFTAVLREYLKLFEK